MGSLVWQEQSVVCWVFTGPGRRLRESLAALVGIPMIEVYENGTRTGDRPHGDLHPE